MMSLRNERGNVAALLLEQGLVTADQLRIAEVEHTRTRRPLPGLLVALGFVSEATLRDALGATLGHRPIALEHAVVDPDALRRIPREIARRHRLLPLRYEKESERMTVAMADPDDIVAIDHLRSVVAAGLQVNSLLAGESEIAQAIDRHYGHELSIDGILHEIETGQVDFRSLGQATGEYAQPVVRLVDALLTDAVKRGASDIHFEPEASFLRIRYRVDGLLRQIRALHKSYWPAMTVRLKVITGMNIAETRAPQDGRVSLNINGREFDFRAASQPTIHGENVVLRILDREKGVVPLDRIGFDAEQLEQLHGMMARPEGIVLVTGPTGSGKTTTLYSMLGHLNDERINIMTLEDPVEYPVPMLRQTSIADGVKLDFAGGVRAMMRQDPDVILVGEIRDVETAGMAFRAAMTGHRVFSTLHSNSAIHAIPRLLDIGILPDVAAGNVCGIVAQRLVRRLCPVCRSPYIPDTVERQLLGIGAGAANVVLYRATGCEACEYGGYRGRFALAEVLPFDDTIDELIVRRASARELRDYCAGRGLRTLTQDGVRRALDGSTSVTELRRVVRFG